MNSVLTHAALILSVVMGVMFVIGMAAKDNSLVDIAYGPAFILASWGAWLGNGAQGHPRVILLLLVVALWGIRLALHIGLRHRGRGEDFRYQRFRRQWGNTVVWRSFLQIYLLQGAIILIVATPILLVIGYPGGPLGLLDLLGAALFTLGFLFETVADLQLMRFKANAANRGAIIQHGLWAFSRHPNYFGEAVLWCGICIIAVATPYGMWALISPFVIGFLLLKVSGIPMLEAKYEGNAEFAAYKERTSAFFPWFPQRGNPPPPSSSRRQNGE